MALSACDVGQPDRQPIDAPSPRAVEVLATTDLDDQGQPVLTTVDPGGSTDGVLTTARVAIRFDRYLLPQSVTRQSACFQPVIGTVASFQDCTQEAELLEPTYDPIRREVTYRLQPKERLQPSTKYQLTIFAVADEAAPGFRSFEGVPLEGQVVYQLTTGGKDPEGAKDDLLPQDELFCENEKCLKACGDDEACRASCLDVRSFFQGYCGYSPCHAAGPPQAPLGAAMGLDLSAPELIVATAIGHTAHQSQTGEHAQEPDRNPVRFGRAMPIIDPRNPGNSYVLYKLMAGADYAATPAAPPPDEVARLRASVVTGMPMPAPPAGGIELADLETLSLWIAQGAVAHACE